MADGHQQRLALAAAEQPAGLAVVGALGAFAGGLPLQGPAQEALGEAELGGLVGGGSGEHEAQQVGGELVEGGHAAEVGEALVDGVGELAEQGEGGGVGGPAVLEGGEELADAAAGERRCEGGGQLGLGGVGVGVPEEAEDEGGEFDGAVVLALAGRGEEDLGAVVRVGQGGGALDHAPDALPALVLVPPGLRVALDLLAGGARRAGEPVEADGVDLRDVTHRRHLERLQRGDGAGGEAGLGERGVGGGLGGELVGVGGRHGAGGEAGAPVEEHLGGGVVPGGGVAGQGAGEEGGELRGGGGVEPGGVNGRLVGDGGRVREAVAVDGRVAGGHLEQDDGGGVALGGRVVLAARGEERVEVGAGAGLDVGGGGLGQGEVEEDEVLGAVSGAAALGADAEVGGLDVAVGDAGVVEDDEGLQQVGAPAVEEIEGESLSVAEVGGEGLATGGGQEEGTAAGDLQRTLDELDDAWAVDLAQGAGLVLEAAGGGVVDGHLEDALGAVVEAEVLDQQADGGGAGAQAALQLEPAAEEGAGAGVEGVGRLLLRGAGGGGVEGAEEGCHVGEAVGDLRVGGLEDGVAEGGRHLGELDGDVESALLAEAGGEVRAVAGGELAAGDEVERERAEGEDVEAEAVRGANLDALGGGERGARPTVGQRDLAGEDVGQLGDAAGGLGVGGLVGAADALPVADLHLEAAVAVGVDEDGARVEAAVDDVLAVGVGERFGDLADEGELVVETEGGSAGEPEVEALPGGVVGVDEAGAEVGVDQILGAEDGVVAEVLHDAHLVLGDATDASAGLVGRTLRDGAEADAAAGLEELVGAEPVLPTRAVVDGLGVEDEAACLALVGAQPDELHHSDDGVLADLAAWVRGAVEQLGDGGEAGGGLVAGEAVEVAAVGFGEIDDQVRVVEEDGFLDVGDDLAGWGRRGVEASAAAPVVVGAHQLGAQALGLAVGEAEGGVLRSAAVAEPGLVVAAEASGVVLQLDQVEAVGGEDEEVHLGPVAAVVAELEAGPGAKGGALGEEVADDAEAVGFVRELGGGDFDPPVVDHAAPPCLDAPSQLRTDPEHLVTGDVLRSEAGHGGGRTAPGQEVSSMCNVIVRRRRR